MHWTTRLRHPVCSMRRATLPQAPTESAADETNIASLAAERTDEQAPASVQPSGEVARASEAGGANPQQDAAARQNGQPAKSIRICSGTVPAADLPCRTVCFMRAAEASRQLVDGQPDPAGLHCCVLPHGPSLTSLQEARCLIHPANAVPGAVTMHPVEQQP